MSTLIVTLNDSREDLLWFMNREFSYQTVKKLLLLSDYIVSEKDSGGVNYWKHHMEFIFDKVQKIASLGEEARNLSDIEILTSELHIDPWLMKQQNVAYLLSTDPFVPRQIREKVSDFYFERVVEMSLIYTTVMSQFCAALYNNQIKDRDDLKIQVWVKLGDAYFSKGWGWERTERILLELRSSIEKYLLDLK